MHAIRRIQKTTLLLSALVFCLSLGSTALTNPKASALNGSSFNAGHIIDDVIFTNANSMNAQDIQNFLNAKVPTCDSWGTQTYAGTTRAAYSRARNHPLPLVCLKDYYENTSTHANNLTVTDGQAVSPPAGSISAAQIIYNAAQSYNINPQVLLTTMQKEQGLVTDDWPWTNQFTTAMGYGCPDSASCNTSYYGLYNQVTNAARQFRRYLDNPNNYNYTVGNDFILYSPGGGCSGSTVTIQNAATAALYDYTPYQPNNAALSTVSDSGTGNGGDSCSSYGNRNFWWYFNNWFGSSLTNPYASAVRYGGMAVGLKTSQSFTAKIMLQNLGLNNWYDDTTASGAGQHPVHLAATGPINRDSIFAASTWYNHGRPSMTFSHVYEGNGTTLATDQHTALPGQVVEYDFTMQIPIGTNPGTYREWFQPILEGAPVWWIGGNTFTDINVQSTSFNAALTSQSSTTTVNKGSSATVFLTYKNTGNIEWYDTTGAAAVGGTVKPMHLATSNGINRDSVFGSTWINPGRPAQNFTAVYESDGTTLAANQHMASPGQIVKYDYPYTIPIGTNPGTYREWFQPILEGAPVWWIGGNTFTDINVQSTSFNAALTSQSSTTTVNKGSSATVFLTYKNTGNIEWYDTTGAAAVGGTVKPMHLATSNGINRDSVFGSTWINPGRPAQNFTAVYESDGTTLAANQHMASPGQIVKYQFTLSAAANLASGGYDESFQPILEGAPAWWMGGGATLHVTVP